MLGKINWKYVSFTIIGAILVMMAVYAVFAAIWLMIASKLIAMMTFV